MVTMRLYWILSIFITLLGILLLRWFRLTQATKKWVEESTLSFNEAGRLAYDFAIDGNTIIISTYSRIPTTTWYRIYIYIYDGKLGANKQNYRFLNMNRSKGIVLVIRLPLMAIQKTRKMFNTF